MCMNPGKRGRMVSADNGNGKERKRNRKAGTVLCTQMEDRTVSFYIKEWVQNRKEPGKGIWEIKLSNVIIFCHCNADIKSDLSWKICPEISRGIVFVEEEWKVLCCCARKSKEIPESYSLKEAIYDLGVLGGTKGAPSDGMPGVRSIWQGLDVLYSLLAYRNYLV